jgi:predicted nucleotidyltransferase
MAQTWRKALRAWGNQCALEFQNKLGVLGIVIGGSLARGQEWRHSDLELGILVEERKTELPYFNVIGGRGVEAIQLIRSELEAQIGLVEKGDLTPVSHWPIQLWACRLVYDPTGILKRFKLQFDAELFTPEVVGQKIAGLRQRVETGLAEARGLLSDQKPAAALAKARLAMNEAIQAVYWAHGELPRSQNRTDSRLRWLCRKYDLMPFYEIYRDVFGLNDAAKAIKISWPKVKEQALEITRLWGGDSARDFFLYAVDGDFAWRQNAGILTVYRLFIPILGDDEHGIHAKLDDPEWVSHNPDMMDFLGFTHANHEAVAILLDRIVEGCNFF